MDIAKNYGMIIIDECHHTAAYTFEAIGNRVKEIYRNSKEEINIINNGKIKAKI